MKIPLMTASSVSVPLLIMPTIFILLSLMASAASSHHHHSLLHISSISAAPTTLPSAPVSSPATISASPSVLPALSPDITPLLPSPKGGAASPADSSLPVIPSSPSPPNPDYIMGAPGPVSGLEPSGAVLPESASGSGGVNLPAVIFCSLGVGFLVQGALI